jgi:glyoxylase-like metal-dependent hydrolase (beta-lactamase superfamily II)
MKQLYSLPAGFFRSDGGAMFGLLPKTVWGRKYPVDADNVCPMAMRCLLLKTPEAVILFDAGAGTATADPRLAPYRFSDRRPLGELLAACGVRPDEVTHVVLSHLHFDHCGGLLTPDGRELLTRARYYVGRRQWEYALRPRLFDADAFFAEHRALLEGSGRLVLIGEDCELAPDVELRLYDGHTPGQLATFVKGEERAYVVCGDIVPMALSVYPESISAFDMEPAVSLESRLALLAEATRRGAELLLYHDAVSAAVAPKRIGSGYRPALSAARSTGQDAELDAVVRQLPL